MVDGLEDRGHFRPAGLVDRHRHPVQRGVVAGVHRARLERVGGAVEEGPQRGAGDRVAQALRHLAPVLVADVGARPGAEVVLDRPAPPRRRHLLDAAAFLQHAHVVGDVAERRREQLGQLARAGVAKLDDFEDLHPQRMPERPHQALIDAVRSTAIH